MRFRTDQRAKPAPRSTIQRGSTVLKLSVLVKRFSNASPKTGKNKNLGRRFTRPKSRAFFASAFVLVPLIGSFPPSTAFVVSGSSICACTPLCKLPFSVLAARGSACLGCLEFFEGSFTENKRSGNINHVMCAGESFIDIYVFFPGSGIPFCDMIEGLPPV